MLKNIKEKSGFMAIRLAMKKEDVKNGFLNGNKDELHEMFGIGTTIAVAAMVFLLFYAAMQTFAPVALKQVTDYFTKILTDNLKAATPK